MTAPSPAGDVFCPVAYLAPASYAEVLQAELDRMGIAYTAFGRLLCCDQAPASRPVWAQNTWYAPRRFAAPSISQAAKLLKSQQRNWVCYSHAHHRRAALIQEKLPPLKPKLLQCCDPIPTSPLGSWTLLDEQTLLAATHCESPFAHGDVAFAEDKTGPPSRAYLKLWETFTRLGVHPEPGQRCLDLGASPGGWTWVLASLGCQVLAVDRAPLDPRVAAMPGVTQRQGSAFGIDPRSSKNDVHPDWIFSDVICYPAKLLTYIRRWLEYGQCRRFVCTLKFQGETDFDTIDAFQALGGTLLHLSCNKHELTWVSTEALSSQG